LQGLQERGIVGGLGIINDLYNYLLAGKNELDTVIGLVVEAVRHGEPVYLTRRATQYLKDLLERYGIRLVPAQRTEDEAIVIDIKDGKAKIIVRTLTGEGWLSTRYELEEFIKTLDRWLRRSKRLILFLLGLP